MQYATQPPARVVAKEKSTELLADQNALHKPYRESQESEPHSPKNVLQITKQVMSGDAAEPHRLLGNGIQKGSRLQILQLLTPEKGKQSIGDSQAAIQRN